MEIGDGTVGGTVALGGVRPVADAQAAVGADDHVGRHEVAVADLDVVLHAVEPHEELVADGVAEHLGRRVDHAGVLVLLAAHERRPVRVDVELELDELVEKVVAHARVLVADLAHGLALDLLGRDGPCAVDLADLDDLGDVDASLLGTGEVERLVEDVRGGLVGVEDLDDGVTAVVDHLVAALDDDFLVLGKFHESQSSLMR